MQLLFEFFTIEEGPEYRPLGDFRSVPEAGWPRQQIENKGRACTHVLFLSKAELEFFSFLKIVEIVQLGWYLPPQKIQRKNLDSPLRFFKSLPSLFPHDT